MTENSFKPDEQGKDESGEELERKSSEFKRLLEVPVEERDRVQKMQVIDRAAAAKTLIKENVQSQAEVSGEMKVERGDGDAEDQQEATEMAKLSFKEKIALISTSHKSRTSGAFKPFKRGAVPIIAVPTQEGPDEEGSGLRIVERALTDFEKTPSQSANSCPFPSPSQPVPQKRRRVEETIVEVELRERSSEVPTIGAGTSVDVADVCPAAGAHTANIDHIPAPSSTAGGIPSSQLVSVLLDRPPRCGALAARLIRFGPDMDVLRERSISDVFDSGCSLGVQFLQHFQNLHDRATTHAAQVEELQGVVHALQSDASRAEAEHLKTLYTLQSEISYLEEDRRKKDTEHAEHLETLQRSFREQLTEISRQAVDAYLNSPEFKAAVNVKAAASIDEYKNSADFQTTIEAKVKEGIKEFKSSTRGREWIEIRAAEYLVQGFTRCQYQLETMGLLDHAVGQSVLKIEEPAPGEYQISSIEDMNDDDDDDDDE